jgi:ZIP family zinc transporter
MIEALIVGLVASSSLLIGAVIAIFHQVQERTLGLVMAFGAGVLISAVAYNLVADALEFAGGGSIVIGLFSGAAAFFIGDLLIDRKGGSGRKSIEGQASSSSATAIVL